MPTYVYRHKPTGALASVAGPSHSTGPDRGPKIGVVWHDRFNTTGSFTRAEFAAEFEPAPWCDCGHLIGDHSTSAGSVGCCLAGSDNGGCLCRTPVPAP